MLTGDKPFDTKKTHIKKRGRPKKTDTEHSIVNNLTEQKLNNEVRNEKLKLQHNNTQKVVTKVFQVIQRNNALEQSNILRQNAEVFK